MMYDFNHQVDKNTTDTQFNLAFTLFIFGTKVLTFPFTRFDFYLVIEPSENVRQKKKLKKTHTQLTNDGKNRRNEKPQQILQLHETYCSSFYLLFLFSLFVYYKKIFFLQFYLSSLQVMNFFCTKYLYGSLFLSNIILQTFLNAYTNGEE